MRYFENCFHNNPQFPQSYPHDSSVIYLCLLYHLSDNLVYFFTSWNKRAKIMVYINLLISDLCKLIFRFFMIVSFPAPPAAALRARKKLFEKPLTKKPFGDIIQGLSGTECSARPSGCGAVGSALPWGGRGRWFKSSHSENEKGRRKRRPFSCVCRQNGKRRGPLSYFSRSGTFFSP